MLSDKTRYNLDENFSSHHTSVITSKIVEAIFDHVTHVVFVLLIYCQCQGRHLSKSAC